MKRTIYKICDGVTCTDVEFDNGITYCKHVDKREWSSEFGTRWLMYSHVTKNTRIFTELNEFKRLFRASAAFKRNRPKLGLGTYKTKCGKTVLISNINPHATACLQGHIHVPQGNRMKLQYETWTIHGDYMFTGNHNYDLVKA